MIAFFDKDVKLRMPFLVYEADGETLRDLTGWTVKLLIGAPGSIASTQKTLDVDADQVANKGLASYLLAADDFTRGNKYSQLQLSKGTGEVIHTLPFYLSVGHAIRSA